MAKRDKMSNTLLYSNIGYYYVLNLNPMIGIIVYEKWFWTEMICQPKILYFPVDCEKGGLCFYDVNTPKLNHKEKMPISTNGVCFKFLPLVVFNFNKKSKIIW